MTGSLTSSSQSGRHRATAELSEDSCDALGLISFSVVHYLKRNVRMRQATSAAAMLGKPSRKSGELARKDKLKAAF